MDSNLFLLPADESVIYVPYQVSPLVEPRAEGLAFAEGPVDTYKVTLKRGNIGGVGVSVSGLGAWARMTGSFSFKLQQLETSQTYNRMQRDYSIKGGIGAFFGWLGIGANASTYSSEIRSTFDELKTSTEVNGTVNVDLFCSGYLPNVQVDASAYVLVLQIKDSQGNTIATTFSPADPKADVGAQDSSNGQKLPTDQNNSTITI